MGLLSTSTHCANPQRVRLKVLLLSRQFVGDMSSVSQSTSAQGNLTLSKYRKYLLSLSENLYSKDLEKLKFGCLDVVPREDMQQVTDGFKLFDLLEQKGAITPQDVTFLQGMMHAIGRDDLALERINIRDEMQINGMKRQSCFMFRLLDALIMFILNI